MYAQFTFQQYKPFKKLQILARILEINNLAIFVSCSANNPNLAGA